MPSAFLAVKMFLNIYQFHATGPSEHEQLEVYQEQHPSKKATYKSLLRAGNDLEREISEMTAV